MTVDMDHLLLGFGFFWMVVGCVLGMVQGIKHIGHHARLDVLAKAGDLRGYHQESSAFKHRTTTHTHTILFSLVAITIGLTLPFTGYSGIHTTVLTMSLIAAMIIWTIGGVFNLRPVMGLGDMLLLGSIVMTLVGLSGVNSP